MINNENFIFLILSFLSLVVIYTKKGKNKKQQKRVKFNAKPEIYYIKSLKDYDLWWK